jgi:hypothetical protein
METIRSSETSVHTRTTGRYIPENGILHPQSMFLPYAKDQVSHPYKTNANYTFLYMIFTARILYQTVEPVFSDKYDLP